jgi:hypothetical protein
VPLFLRRCVARNGQEALFRQELVRTHEERAPRARGLLEIAVYRETTLGREFLTLAIYEDDAAVVAGGRKSLLEGVDECERRFGEAPGISMRLESRYEYASVPQKGAHSAAAMLICRPQHVARFRERLPEAIAALAERLAPRRIILGQGVERPEHFVVMGDSEHRFDVDRYLTSALGRRHRSQLEPYLAEPPRYYLLDPVWRYFRRFSGGTLE